MKEFIKIKCPECIEDVFSSNGEDTQISVFLVDHNNSGEFEMICSKDHHTNVLLTNERHELLFEFGINAFQDNYFREAAFDFYASLEQFYEFSVDFFCEIKEIDEKILERTKGLLGKLSERQLGAYIYLRLITMNMQPDSCMMDQTKFRNRIVHQGLIPEKEHVKKTGKEIYEYITSEISQYKAMYENEFKLFLYKRVQKRIREAKASGKKINIVVYDYSALNTNLFPQDIIRPFEEVLVNAAKVFQMTSKVIDG